MHTAPKPESGGACRLCGGIAASAFHNRVLDRYDVEYFRCDECGSLECEAPYWLTEAYADDEGDGAANLSDLDTGAAQRNLLTAAATMLVARVLGLRDIIDFGGGDGFLCRLLRDYGFNAFVSDRYAKASYARGFTQPDFAKPDLVTAFEVLEHFADPKRDAEEIFGRDATAVLISTEIYCDQGRDWWYLAPETGQHVFFYSRMGLEIMGRQFGYKTIRAGFFTLFVKPHVKSAKINLLRIMLRGRPLKLVRASTAFLSPRGVMEDFAKLQRQNVQFAVSGKS